MPCPSSSETSADIKVNGEEQSTKKVSKGQRRIAEVDEVALHWPILAFLLSGRFLCRMRNGALKFDLFDWTDVTSFCFWSILLFLFFAIYR